ncbi:disease resistance protein (TIR-NBS-LRR class) [Melia azedarach]|uniref:Disease resistance protein (TIR-NBS-LRR class) n=1 Tax=Melia azedarach TaxID=155640 RepID=A0ACC1XRD2_MELAZ|nr:disease resistance protein (TIR-NBS-LRR class) [Melia azedarach]
MLYLPGCSNLQKVPEISSSQIERLFLDGTAIEELPSSIERLSRLVTLNLQNCLRLEQLPESISKLKSLRDLYLSGCSNLQRLPDELGNLKALKRLNAKRIAAREVPSSIVYQFCSALTSKSDYQLFDLSNCFKLDRNELREIGEDAQQKIQLIATALWKTRDQKHHQQYRGTVSFPGGEIPNWFKMQSFGSAVALKLPPEFFGCLLNSNSKLNTVDWRVAFGDTLLLGNIIDDDNSETGHVYLTYNFSGKYFDAVEESYFNSNNEALIQFYVKHLFGGKLMESCEITKCGIRLFYAQDFRESAENSSCRSYGTDVEEELPPKRLKH